MQCHSYTKYVAVLEFKPLLYREMFHHISGVGSDHFTDVTSTVVTSRCERKLYFDTFFPRQHDSFLLSSLDVYDSNWIVKFGASILNDSCSSVLSLMNR